MTETTFTQHTFTQHTVTLDTGPVAYLKGGTGRPILHLHPAGGPRVTPAMQLLAPRHTIYVPTTPGFSGTPVHDTVASMPELADLAAKFARTVIGGPCDVVAESFGGWEALWLAVRHPDLVEQLVLQAPAGLRTEGTGGFHSNDPADRMRRLYAIPERAPQETRSPEVIAGDQRMYARYTGGITLDPALQAALPTIKARTLVLFGTQDEVVPLDAARRLMAGIPQARLTYVWRAAHVPEFDQPEKVSRLIGAFMELGEGYVVPRPATA
ncbi:MAG TPA: alpha/beta hydrolase [Hyphomicrobiaceae bacterium]|nr:alpha/beta hydrolase [Hyphomicrobiaceae bacterium]